MVFICLVGIATSSTKSAKRGILKALDSHYAYKKRTYSNHIKEICYLSAEFFTGHSQGKHWKFSPTNFTRTQSLWQLDFIESMLEESKRFCLVMVSIRSGWLEFFLSSKRQCSGNESFS